MTCRKKRLVGGIGQCCICNKNYVAKLLKRWGEYWICVFCLKKEEAKK